MAGAGFGLVEEHRPNPALLADLFIGVNALFCNPAESVLPILVASFLGEGYSEATPSSPTTAMTGPQQRRQRAWTPLQKLSCTASWSSPSLVFSVLQALLWSRYSLVPETTERLRGELREHEDRGNGNGNIGVPLRKHRRRHIPGSSCTRWPEPNRTKPSGSNWMMGEGKERKEGRFRNLWRRPRFVLLWHRTHANRSRAWLLERPRKYGFSVTP